jgi:hypothetical protein
MLWPTQKPRHFLSAQMFFSSRKKRRSENWHAQAFYFFAAMRKSKTFCMMAWFYKQGNTSACLRRETKGFFVLPLKTQ